MQLSADERNLLLVVPAAFAAALWLPAVPWWVAGALVVVGSARFRPPLIVVGLLLVIGVRSEAAVTALRPAPTAPVSHLEIRLAADPTPTDVSWRAIADTPSGRLVVEGRGSVAAALSRRAVGDRLVVSGTQRGAVPATAWQRSRGLVGRLDVTDVHSFEPDTGLPGAATAYRRWLIRGASSIPSGDRALFAGLVHGDDREQRAIDADAFRAAGLGHLLAVSGQNVVFVLLVVGPGLSRIRNPWLRFTATGVVLILFGFVTRFEASVTRALVMAVIASFASTRGSPMAAVRIMPPAVVGLLLVQPLLAWSLAFQLSVCATAGLVLGAHRIEARIRGPRWLAVPLAATTAAQLAVAPLLLSTFGSVSLLALPANVLAGPAAAFTMMWGLTAGAVAAAAPPSIARVLHLPTRLAIDWITLVAETAATVPVGRFGPAHLVTLLVGLGVLAWGRRLGRLIGPALVAVALLVPVIVVPDLEPGRHALIEGVTLYRSVDGHDVLVLDRTGGAESVLAALRTAQPGRIDLLLVTSPSRGAGRLVAVLRDRHDIVDIWAPPGHQVPAGRVHPANGRVGGLAISWPDGSAPVVRPLAGGRSDTPGG